MSSYPLDYKIWALLANWSRYDSIGAIEAGHDELWSTGGKRLRIGDPVIVWQTTDEEGRRGIVGLGVVLTASKVQADRPSPFTRGDHTYEQQEDLVDVRYIGLPNGPIWTDGPDSDVALDLSVSRGRGSATFEVSKSQWQAVLEAAGMTQQQFRSTAYPCP